MVHLGKGVFACINHNAVFHAVIHVHCTSKICSVLCDLSYTHTYVQCMPIFDIASCLFCRQRMQKSMHVYRKQISSLHRELLLHSDIICTHIHAYMNMYTCVYTIESGY